MALDLLPHTKPLGYATGPGGEYCRVKIDKAVSRSTHGLRLTRVVEELSKEWPRLARAVDSLSAKRFRPPTYGRARVATYKTVTGYLDVSKSALQDSLTEVSLLGMQITGYSVGGSFEEIVVHEWGHLLLHVDIARRYLHGVDEGIEDFVQLIERESGVSREEAGAALSTMARIDSRELIAEAFVAARSGSEDPFPRKVVEAFTHMWAEPEGIPGWAI